jgi:hypothetical protein
MTDCLANMTPPTRLFLFPPNGHRRTRLSELGLYGEPPHLGEMDAQISRSFVAAYSLRTHVPPLPSVYLLMSVSSNDLMDQTYIKVATRCLATLSPPSSPCHSTTSQIFRLDAQEA